ncbi:hypothetical protein [Streptomyces orinoci]|uniref:PRC-barrel domain containing protein n=1 Tax=Streptomyces orinoci TaxID=67339 RepID=A0ABV3K6T9_STRON|nr:hypothetical protein [Streptomyces orinoci]
MSADRSALPKKGAFVVDTARGTVGQVMDHLDDHIQLRPSGGALEWDANPAAVRPVTATELKGAEK